ncbi:MAG: YceI family protein, partial [Bacteroidia bacterium]
ADISLVGNNANGDAIVDQDGGWVYDGTHSNINFEFSYDAGNADFKGLFGEAGFNAFKFDESTPANTVIDAYVYLPSVETGSPTLAPNGHGRDDINGCMMGTFGVEPREADTLDDGSGYYREDAAATEDHTGSGYALLKSKSVESYGDGYKATCDLTFNGNTGEVVLYFKYIEGFQAEDRSGNLTQFSSFEGFFDFAAQADFGIESGHVADEIITVDLGIQWTKTL